MAADFGMSGYDPGDLESISAILRGLRVAAGDFADDEPPEPPAPAEPPERPAPTDPPAPGRARRG
jgi:hypothetical protein